MLDDRRKMVEETLSLYGASLDETTNVIIKPDGRVSAVEVSIRKDRLRFEGISGNIYASGPVTPKTVESFVEGFWYWSKPK